MTGMTLNDSQFISLSFLVALSFAALLGDEGCGKHSNSRSETQMNQQNSEQTGGSVSEGVWGGEHIHLEVSNKGATLEFDCAHGKILEPLTLDHAGRFQAKGTFTREHGGPVRETENDAGQAAKYSGSIKDKKMTLSITLTDSSESLGTFNLVQGREGDLVKCR
jgi:hypothetical protein